MSNTAKVCWCLSCMDENQLITDVEFFHWLRPVFCLIVVLVLECDKSLSFSHTFCSVGNVQISSDVFGFVVNSVDRVSVRFLVGRCNVVHDQLVLRSFVHFVVVGCFVGRYKCFRRIVDFPDVML